MKQFTLIRAVLDQNGLAITQDHFYGKESKYQIRVMEGQSIPPQMILRKNLGLIIRHSNNDHRFCKYTMWVESEISDDAAKAIGDTMLLDLEKIKEETTVAINYIKAHKKREQKQY